MPERIKRARRGTGSVRRMPDGSVQLRITIEGKRHSFYGATLADAQAKADAARRKPIIRARGGVKLRDWLVDWLETSKGRTKPQTWRMYEARARIYLVPLLGDVSLAALGPDHLDRLHAVLSRSVAPTTAHHVHMTFSAALGVAERRGLVSRNVCRTVQPPRRTQEEIETLSRDEVGRLVEAVRGDELEALWILAVTMGPREGELLGLRWRDVDLTAGRLRIVGSAGRDLDGAIVVSTPKTSSGSRTLHPLPAVVIDALRRTERRGELVWPDRDGKPFHGPTFYKRHWLPLRERAELPPVTVHALRHTAATRMLENGVQAHVVAAMLGHASVATTLRLYAHVTRSSLDAATAAIDRDFGGPSLRVVEKQ